jgi:CarboxypepD_reg-like domain/Gram-negative bacterial TonB protein C-terminal
MNHNSNHINYTAADIEKYWKGQLTPTQMHALEKAAMDDPFLADALEGYRNTNKPTAPALEALANRLADRVSDKKVVALPQTKWWRAAAAAVVLLGGSALAYQLFFTPKQKDEIATITNNNPAAGNAVTDTATNTQSLLNTDTTVNSTLAFTETKPLKPASFTIKEEGTTVARDSINLPPNADVAISTPAAAATDDAKTRAAATETNKDALAKKTEPANEKEVKGLVTNNNFLSNRINGIVLDPMNQPVAGAIVKLEGAKNNIITQTDKLGNFSFNYNDSVALASVSSVGFQTQQLQLRNDVNYNNRILLQPMNNNLNEVVVVGYGADKKKNSTPSARNSKLNGAVQQASPAIGMDEYNIYLEKNKRVPDSLQNLHGDVVLSFEVNSKGTYKDFRIEKSLQPLLDAEAIRLVKEGPSWKLLSGRKTRAAVIVRF